MRRFLTVLGLVGVISIVLSLVVSFQTGVREVHWEGSTNEDMLAVARVDITNALETHAKVLKVHIVSPGGPIFTSLEIARLVREAYDHHGLIVEIHAHTLCASGCTLVLAAGTPGHRYIDRLTLFLVHSVQSQGLDGKTKCMMFVQNPTNQAEKALDVLLIIMRDTYLKYTHIDKDALNQMLTCGNEQIGRGEFAVGLGFADKVE